MRIEQRFNWYHPSLRLWELNQVLIDTTPPEEVDSEITGLYQQIWKHQLHQIWNTNSSDLEHSSLPPSLADTTRHRYQIPTIETIWEEGHLTNKSTILVRIGQ